MNLRENLHFTFFLIAAIRYGQGELERERRPVKIIKFSDITIVYDWKWHQSSWVNDHQHRGVSVSEKDWTSATLWDSSLLNCEQEEVKSRRVTTLFIFIIHFCVCAEKWNENWCHIKSHAVRLKMTNIWKILIIHYLCTKLIRWVADACKIFLMTSAWDHWTLSSN